MKIFEKTAPGLFVLWIAAAFVAVFGVEADAGAWAWWLGGGCVAVGVALLVGIRVWWSRAGKEDVSPAGGEDYPTTAYGGPPPLTRGGESLCATVCREARVCARL